MSTHAMRLSWQWLPMLYATGNLRAGVLGIWGQAACLWFAIGPSLAAKLGATLPATLVCCCAQLNMPAVASFDLCGAGCFALQDTP